MVLTGTALNQRTVLNLGSGRKYKPEAVNLDCTARTGPDVVHDLHNYPWPFEDGRFSQIEAYDVLEHLDDLIAAMEEIHRVSADGAIVKITVPHFSSANAFRDPTHRHYFSWFTFDYFRDEHDFGFYSESRFVVEQRRLVFYPTFVNKVVWRLANRYPDPYERRWAWMFPAWYLFFELRVVKPKPS